MILPVTAVSDYNGGASTTVVAPTIALTAGNTAFVAVRSFTEFATGVTDDLSNPYIFVGTGDANQDRLRIYATRVTAGGAAVVTAQLSGSASFRGIAVAQYSGLLPAAMLDQIVTATSSGTTSVTSPAFTTQQAEELIFAAVQIADAGGSQWTPPAGYTVRTQVASGVLAILDRIVSTIQVGETVTGDHPSTAAKSIIVVTSRGDVPVTWTPVIQGGGGALAGSGGIASGAS